MAATPEEGKGLRQDLREDHSVGDQKAIVGSSIGLRKVIDWTLWRGRPPPKRKKRRPKHSPQKKKKCRYACRLFGINGLKEGTLWHIDPLVGNDRETNNYITATAK
jgi:hypothetical protein